MKDRRKDDLAQGGGESDRLEERGKVRVKKDSKFSTVEQKQNMGSAHFFNIYNYNNNNGNNNNNTNNHNFNNSSNNNNN